MIYMISNRATFAENGQRLFKNKGAERALPGFRVAECTLSELEETVAYQILNGNAIENGEKMFYQLSQQLKASAGTRSDVLLFIPGYGNTLEKNRKQIFKLYKTYVEPVDSPIGHLLFISWPSKRQPLMTYRKGQRDAVKTGKVLARIYEQYQNGLTELFEAGWR